jgi:hypothetical protein
MNISPQPRPDEYTGFLSWFTLSPHKINSPEREAVQQKTSILNWKMLKKHSKLLLTTHLLTWGGVHHHMGPTLYEGVCIECIILDVFLTLPYLIRLVKFSGQSPSELRAFTITRASPSIMIR